MVRFGKSCLKCFIAFTIPWLLAYLAILIFSSSRYDKNAIDILRKKVEEVSYPLVEDDRYTDESKDILNFNNIK